MLTLVDNQNNNDEPTHTLSITEARKPEACPLKLALADSADALKHVTRAIDQTQRRLDNLRDLIDRFELDDDDDGPRAA
ncbi:MAG: hypothetical protein ACIAQU_01150 [Phycisphaerales bacterium JB064]